MSNIPQKFHLVTEPGVNFSPAPALFLDTLAQLTPFPRKAVVQNEDLRLYRRARSKHFTNKIVVPLADIRSELEKYYRNAFYCNEDLVQAGQTITGKYCNTRVCNNCNRIRTAKMINGYKVELDKFTDKQFVTLTAPSVSASELPAEVSRYYVCWRTIARRLVKSKVDYAGIRKLEITYNHLRYVPEVSYRAFHPHFHLIVNGEANARLIQSMWLKLNPGANKAAQDIRPVDDYSLLELFKYSTKIVDKNTGDENVVYLHAVDTIMRALYKRRIIQPFGKITKQVSEDIEELHSQEYPDIPFYDLMEWHWQKDDWMNEYGELLAHYDSSKAKEIVIQP